MNSFGTEFRNFSDKRPRKPQFYIFSAHFRSARSSLGL